MKKIPLYVLLLFSFFVSGPAMAEGPDIEETSGFYRNGNLKYKVFSYRDPSGRECKNVRESYRKNGSRRYDSVVVDGKVTHFRKYTHSGLPAVEKIYAYNFNDVLISIETKRGGVSTFQLFETDLSGEPLTN